jgi:hypothetical protein
LFVEIAAGLSRLAMTAKSWFVTRGPGKIAAVSRTATYAQGLLVYKNSLDVTNHDLKFAKKPPSAHMLTEA